MCYIAQFVGTDWLTNEHINILMEMLQCDLIATGLDKVKVITETTGFMTKLQQAYDHSEHYGDGRQEHCWLERIGQSLVNGSYHHLAFIANVRQNHWVACVVDPAEDAIWHGDSLGGAIDSEAWIEVVDIYSFWQGVCHP